MLESSLGALTFCWAATLNPSLLPAPSPHLVVVIVVDQMRADYLERFRTQWTGGLARLLAEGSAFTQGMQDHAITETAPGHATILSGRDPARVGIVNNSRGVPDSASPLLEATGPGASPWRFVGTTLYDWMLARDPATRLLSVSAKDRGAILPVGRSRGPVFWYAEGRFTTSRYYADSLPAWVRDYNARRGPERLAGTEWRLLLPESAYPEPDSLPFEHGGRDLVFPHRLPATAGSMDAALPDYPWMDSLTFDFALEGQARLGLGTRSRPDLLILSLSATDYIGHAFGPDSREVHDQLLRLDHWLGWFLDSLAVRIPRESILLALTADHGVVPFPELARMRGRPGGRTSLEGLATQVRADLQTRLGEGFGVEFEAGAVTADLDRLRARGVNADSLAIALAVAAGRVPGVRSVYTHASLAAAPGSDQNAARWRRSLTPDFGWLICTALRPGWIWARDSAWTTHGSTNPDDVYVPIIFMGPGVRQGLHRRPVRSTDIAPTLAALLGVHPLERLDGNVIPEVTGGHYSQAEKPGTHHARTPN